MKEIRYLLDENVDAVLRTELMKRESKLVVWKIGDPGVPPKGTPDPEILIWCEENSFILVTNNRKTMPQHLKDLLAKDRHIPAIFQLNPQMSIGNRVNELLLIWGASEVNEFQDVIIYLPIR